MSEESKPNLGALSWEEIAYSNMIQHEAFLRLLVKKGIITKEEFLAEVKAAHEDYQKQTGESGEEGSGA
jgi:hypothetical protein